MRAVCVLWSVTSLAWASHVRHGQARASMNPTPVMVTNGGRISSTGAPAM
jgi:hypothetical protein